MGAHARTYEGGKHMFRPVEGYLHGTCVMLLTLLDSTSPFPTPTSHRVACPVALVQSQVSGA